MTAATTKTRRPNNPLGTCRKCERPLMFRRGRWIDEEEGLPNCRAYEPHEPIPRSDGRKME